MKTNNKIQMFAVAAVALAAVACTDTWDEHYGNEGRPVSDKSLLQVMEEQGDLGDFLKVLRATHVFSNNKPTKVTYADLLASDQTFTVWAPKDGLFNVDSLLAECQTVSGDSMCGQHFVQNHIAHFITNSTDEKQVLMLNNNTLMQFRVLSKVCRMLRGELMERRRTESCTCFQVESPTYIIYMKL